MVLGEPGVFELLGMSLGLPSASDEKYHIGSIDELCSDCRHLLVSKHVAETTVSEEDYWRTTVYSGLACFASGALLGMILGVIQD